MRLVGAFLYAHVSTDARDDEAATLQSRFQADTAGLSTLTKRLQAWVAQRRGRRPRSAAARSPPTTRSRCDGPRQAAAHQMSEAEEDLAVRAGAHRRPGVGQAARRPHLPPHRHGAPPRGRSRDAADERGAGTGHRSGRRRSAGRPTTPSSTAWDTVAVPLAAALNAFKGEANTLNRRRGWERLARPGPVHQQRRPRDARRHAGGGRRVAAGLRPLPPGQGRACSATPTACPWWDLLAPVGATAAAGLARGTSPRWPTRSPPTRRGSPRWSGGPTTRAGSTPSPGPARSAARSACRCRAT